MRQYWRFKGLRALPWTSARPCQRLHTASPISDITLNIFSIARRIFRGLQTSTHPKGSFRLGGSRQPRTRSQSVVLYNNQGVSFGSGLREVARSLFVNNVLRRVTNSRINQLRRRTAQELLGGNSAPFLALIGVSLASGNGILTKEDEIESISHEVRNAVRKTRQDLNVQEHLNIDKSGSWSLADFQIGSVISKGCSAVVYAAKCIKDGFQGIDQDHKDDQEPLAIKMMFNFHAESNAQVIFKAMKKEIIVADQISCEGLEDIAKITPHPNIVKMHLAFSDYVPSLSESMELYPQALPPRINPAGYGRNMSLFMVMKKYKCNLHEYLSTIHDFHWRSRLMLLTQVLEGLVHLSRYKIAHRDLKSDNILVEYSQPDQLGVLVLSDFGCCWHDPRFGFKCPYPTEDMDKGGNAALMAPEVANAEPGLFSFIDYSKADVWATGTLAYEIFGLKNPFYHTKQNRGLDSRSYE